MGAAGYAATGGTAGGGGAAAGGTGGNACTNTTSDAMNCGRCGHSCLGGQCSGGICQPFLLGTIPSVSDAARQTILTGGKVYVFSQATRGTAANAWQLDANTPSTPVEVMTNGTVSCVMNDQLFWVTGAAPSAIHACTFSNCAATTTTIITTASTEEIAIWPAYDSSSNEIVWVTTPTSDAYTTFTIHRASPTGTNPRVITSFDFPSDGTSWSYIGSGYFPGGADRVFYADDSTAGTATSSLYYISTNTVNAAPVLVARVTGSGSFSVGYSQGLVADDTLVLATTTGSSGSEVFSIPLPNGIISGSPPVFTSGIINGGVIDATNFFGSLSGSTVPADALITCPLSDCSSPTIISRGQANASYFADDATAIYWTTNAQTTTQGFSVWKAAK